jgi:hypothetical protein
MKSEDNDIARGQGSRYRGITSYRGHGFGWIDGGHCICRVKIRAGSGGCLNGSVFAKASARAPRAFCVGWSVYFCASGSVWSKRMLQQLASALVVGLQWGCKPVTDRHSGRPESSATDRHSGCKCNRSRLWQTKHAPCNCKVALTQIQASTCLSIKKSFHAVMRNPNHAWDRTHNDTTKGLPLMTCTRAGDRDASIGHCHDLCFAPFHAKSNQYSEWSVATRRWGFLISERASGDFPAIDLSTTPDFLFWKVLFSAIFYF